MSLHAVRHNTVLLQNINNASSFNYIINVPFQPTEMIVKSFSWEELGAGDGTCLINTNLINTGDLFGFYAGPVQGTSQLNQLDLHFNITRQINGSFTFNFIDSDKNLIARTGKLIIHLEFIKY